MANGNDLGGGDLAVSPDLVPGSVENQLAFGQQGQAPAAAAPTRPRIDMALGDSIAVQQYKHGIGGLGTPKQYNARNPDPIDWNSNKYTGEVGAPPTRILARIKDMLAKDPDAVRGKNIELMIGSNQPDAPGEFDAIPDVLSALKGAGVGHVMVPALGPGVQGSGALNVQLGDMVHNANDPGANTFSFFTPNIKWMKDGVHPANAPDMMAEANKALMQTATVAPMVDETPTATPAAATAQDNQFAPVPQYNLQYPTIGVPPGGYQRTAGAEPAPGTMAPSPGAANVQSAIAALRGAGASDAFVQAALNQPFYEGGWRNSWAPSGIADENSFGHLQFNDKGELPGYMKWVSDNAPGQDPHSSGLQFQYLASRVPQSVLTGDDPRAITDYLNTNFERFKGAAPGMRYEHLGDAANLMQGNYSAVGGGGPTAVSGTGPYMSGDVVPGTGYAVGGELAYLPQPAPNQLAPGGGTTGATTASATSTTATNGATPFKPNLPPIDLSDQTGSLLDDPKYRQAMMLQIIGAQMRGVQFHPVDYDPRVANKSSPYQYPFQTGLGTSVTPTSEVEARYGFNLSPMSPSTTLRRSE